MTNPENTQKKKPLFGEIEDIISIGALLRPTITKAIGELSTANLSNLRAHVIEAERELANSRLGFRERFERAQEALRSTYSYAPIWRFIGGRIEETWTGAATLTVRELSVVSLLFGMMLEETQTRLSQKSKKSA